MTYSPWIEVVAVQLKKINNNLEDLNKILKEWGETKMCGDSEYMLNDIEESRNKHILKSIKRKPKKQTDEEYIKELLEDNY